MTPEAGGIDKTMPRCVHERIEMIVLLRVAVLALFATSAVAAGNAPHGHLMLIGGGDKPLGAMEKFVELAGGKDAPIVVIPTASQEPDTNEYYTNLFRKDYGSTDVVVLPIRSKADANRPELVTAAKRARGIFFGGGDQVRILVALADTPVLEALRDAYRNGAVVGGTSAGTACQSEMMITGEGDFKVIQSRSVELWDGLGFLRSDVIVDQHFIARQRQNRLLSVLLEHPGHLGIGVDEDTAIWVRPDDTFEVIGAGSVMVFDPAGATIQRSPGTPGKELLGVHGMRMHIVLPGEVFDLERRAPVEAPAKAASR
jgi:cyanophycinase